MRRQDLPSSNQESDDWDCISDLETDAPTTYNSLEAIVTTENNETEDKAYGQNTGESTKRNVELGADFREVRGEGECSVAGHGPGESGGCGIGADDDEIVDAHRYDGAEHASAPGATQDVHEPVHIWLAA